MLASEQNLQVMQIFPHLARVYDKEEKFSTPERACVRAGELAVRVTKQSSASRGKVGGSSS